VETTRALEDRYGDRHLTVGRRRQPWKRAQGDGGSRQNFAAARGRLTRRAVPARRNGRGHKEPTVDKRRRKNQTKDNVARTDVQEETSLATRMQQQHKETRPKRAIMPGKQDNARQDLQDDRRAEGRKANSRDFH
jgi:hypothetical protein